MDNTQHTIKVLLADDHQVILDGLELIFSQDPEIEIIGQAHDGEEALTKARSAVELDVLVLDINMPRKDGMEICQELKGTFAEIKILVLSMYNKPAFVKTLIEVGVDGYVRKNAGKKELLTAVKSLARGETYFDAEITRTMMAMHRKQRIFDSPNLLDITEKEKQIIRLVGAGDSTATIADKLCLSVHTINTYRKQLLQKIGAKNAAGIIRFGMQTGIIKNFDL